MMQPMPAILMCSLLFGISAVFDLRFRRIPNYLTVPACLAGLGYHAATSGLEWGCLYAFKGMGTGLLLLMIPFLLRYAGGGDVKLLAASGSFLGVSGVVNLFLYGSIAGGIWALILIVTASGPWQTVNILWFPSTLLKTLPGQLKRRGVPYAAAMAMGFCCYLTAGPVI